MENSGRRLYDPFDIRHAYKDGTLAMLVQADLDAYVPAAMPERFHHAVQRAKMAAMTGDASYLQRCPCGECPDPEKG